MSEYEDFNSYLQQEHLVKQTTSKPTEIDKLKIEIERQKNIIKGLEKLELYTAEEDYDYEENIIEKYVPFDIEDFINELKGDSCNE